MTHKLKSTYDPFSIEATWYRSWEKNNYFAPSGSGIPYSIMIPPPNVTGSLHMGHAFQDTIMDALIRHKRMTGNDTLWQVGTDHAGIATQMLVERQLLASNISRHELGRDKFLGKVWEWKHTSGGMITEQLRRMGASVDWSRERFTMDEGYSRAVSEVFIRLFDEHLIYRGKKLVNWDPVLQTAISDLEVISEEELGSLWQFRYPLSDKSGYLVVATTRPETMLGDAAVAVHPQDERYSHLIGKTVALPLTDREIPIISDSYVDPEFGTGCVKITPAHDFNDYEIGERHGLPIINILTEQATLNSEVPKSYIGMDRFDAREQIIKDLTTLDLLERVDPHKLKVPRGDRSGVIIEPLLTDQWFVAVETLAKPAIQAVKNGSIRFVPKQWENTYFAWMDELKDWCISRQLWWGHRIPAFYDADGAIYVAKDEAAARTKYNLGDHVELTQDDDVLDTWFSSALWTFATLGWPDDTEALRRYHPTSCLVTGFDIIFFWVSRMIMMTLKFTDEVPFRTVYVHGLVRDADGQKMSKSKGNVLDPIDLIDGLNLESLVKKRTSSLMQPQMKQKIEKATRNQFPDGLQSYGTDALRYTFCSLATMGRDINFDIGRVEGYRNFCNKLWNATRFVLIKVGEESLSNVNTNDKTVFDRWIVSELQKTEKKVAESINQYRFDLVSQAIYEFVWNEYCDWYLELSKLVLTDRTINSKVQLTTRYTLVSVLETILRLAHPLIPYITEELWQHLAPLIARGGETICKAPYPEADISKEDVKAESDIRWLKSLVTAVRTIRGEINLSPAKAVPVLLCGGDTADRERLAHLERFIVPLANLSELRFADPEEIPASSTQLIDQLELHVPIANLIDVEAELSRLEKQATKLVLEIEKLSRKLLNPGFCEKAPAEVVIRERGRLKEAKEKLKKVQSTIKGFKSLKGES